jgi:DNA-binding transcriptional LysR family regulator
LSTPDINLRHFLALSEIAAAGRLSAAAERVFISQSALTQGLRKIEQTAGMALFERSGFGVTETAGGKLLVRRSGRALALLKRTAREIRIKHPTVATGGPLHRHITTSQLKALVAVVDTGSYSLAADRLGLSQPTVHRAAKDLESAVGISLFRRAGRGVESSETARHLARYAELVFAEIRQGFEEIREMSGLTDSRVAIGCLPLARSGFVPDAVTLLLGQFPDAQVSIVDGPYAEQLQALRYGQIDWLIGALRDPAPTPDVVQEALFDEPLAVVVRPGHPLLSAASPGVGELAGLEWVAPRALAPARRIFDAFFELSRTDPPTRIIECSSLIATRGILRQSDRAALLSPLQVREDVESGQLALLIGSIPDSSRSIGMTVRDNWEPTMIQAAFADIVRKLAGPAGS